MKSQNIKSVKDEIEEIKEKFPSLLTDSEKFLFKASIQPELFDEAFLNSVLIGIKERIRRMESPFQEPMENVNLEGPVHLGTTLKGLPVGVTDREIVRGTNVFGAIGSGKSYLGTSFLLKFIEFSKGKDMKVHLYDSHGEYQSLKNYFQPSDLLFIDVHSQYRENPNYPPPGISFEDWITHIARAFSSANFMKSHTQNLYMRCALGLFNKTQVIPNLKEMEKWLAQFKPDNSLEKDTRARMINILEPINLTLNSLYNCRKGHPYEKLLDGNICFNISKLKREDKIFFITTHLMRAFLYRQSRGIRGDFLLNLFFIDEGSLVHSAKYENNPEYSIPFIGEIVKTGRQYGIGFCTLDQNPIYVSHTMKSSSYLTLIFKLNEGKDIDDVAKSIGLSKEESCYLRNELPIGQCIFKTNRPDFPYPFVMKVPQLPEPRVEFSEEENEKMLNSLDWGPVKEEKIIEMEKPIQVLSPKAKQLQYAIYSNPFDSITELFAKCGFSPSTGEKAKVELLKTNRAEEFAIALESGRGRQKKSLFLMKKSYQEMGLKPKATTRGGTMHTWGCMLIASFYEPDKSTIEAHYPELNSFIDVVTKTNSKIIAHELCLNFSNLKETIEKKNKGNFDRFIIVFENSQKRDKQRNIISEYEGKGVEFLTLKDFVRE